MWRGTAVTIMRRWDFSSTDLPKASPSGQGTGAARNTTERAQVAFGFAILGFKEPLEPWDGAAESW